MSPAVILMSHRDIANSNLSKKEMQTDFNPRPRIIRKGNQFRYFIPILIQRRKFKIFIMKIFPFFHYFYSSEIFGIVFPENNYGP